MLPVPRYIGSAMCIERIDDYFCAVLALWLALFAVTGGGPPIFFLFIPDFLQLLADLDNSG